MDSGRLKIRIIRPDASEVTVVDVPRKEPPAMGDCRLITAENRPLHTQRGIDRRLIGSDPVGCLRDRFAALRELYAMLSA